MKLLGTTLLLFSATHALAQDGWSWGNEDDFLLLTARPFIEATFLTSDSPDTTTVISDEESFFAPRFSLGLDAVLGEHWFMLTQLRVDRGFDYADRSGGDFRIDELVLRYRAFDDERLNFQLGKFPTVFGAWVNQHDFYDDPFIFAPLPYGHIIGVQQRNLTAMSPAAISARNNGTAPAISALDKRNWASPIWGPSYASGGSVFGSMQHFDYAFEIKSSGLSSHPDQWEDEATDFSEPTFTGRIGYRPDAAWAFGMSASRGTWFSEEEENTLPAGIGRDDLIQRTYGLDLRWAHRDWIVTSEVILSEFEAPLLEDLRTLSWFTGVRYKAAPGVWLAARLGQIVANEIEVSPSNTIPWTPDAWRAELAAGWQIDEHTLLKTNYAYIDSDDVAQGNHLLAMALGWQW